MKSFFAGLSLCLAVIVSWSWSDVASDIRNLTGKHTRVVWSQDQNNEDFRGYDANDKLYGLDTDDGQGERQICPAGDCGASGFTKPLVTMDGARVVFSDRVADNVYVVDFDGSNKRTITKGLAVCVRYIDGKHWVYVRKGDNGLGDAGSDIRRYNIDNAGEEEVIWTKTDVGNVHQIWFTVSGDGARAAGTFPWSSGRVVSLPNGSNLKTGVSGCWTSMAPDNSYRWWIFNDPHVNFEMYDGNNQKVATVAIDGPVSSGQEVYYPRWTTNVNYMVLAGSGVGGAASDIYIGKFASDFKSVTSWVRVTNNSKGDYYPDAWVSSSTTSKTATPSFTPTGSSFSGSVDVTIQCATSGATIRYTTDGSDPDESSTAYSGSVTLSETTTIKARAYKDGLLAGSIASKTYTKREAPVLASVAIVPASVVVQTGTQYTLKATAINQYGDTIELLPDFSWSISDGQSIGASSGVFEAADNAGGPYTVTVSATVDGTTKTATASVTVSEIHIKMNAGANTITGWESQTSFVSGGSDYSTGESIDVSLAEDPAPMALYQSGRHQDPMFTFSSLADGNYKVRFHFAEPNVPAVGTRQMTLLIDGVPVQTQLDLMVEAGSRKACVKEYYVTVNDGNGMEISLSSAEGNDAFVSGLEIIGIQDLPAPLVILDPNGGETFQVGDTVHITWRVDNPMITACVLHITVDGGLSWLELRDEGFSPDDSEWLDFAWVIPSELGGVLLQSTQCRIRVGEYNRATEVYGMSASVFTIASASGIIPTLERGMHGLMSLDSQNGLRIHVRANEYVVQVYRLDGRLVGSWTGTRPGTITLSRETVGFCMMVLRGTLDGTSITRRLLAIQ